MKDKSHFLNCINRPIASMLLGAAIACAFARPVFATFTYSTNNGTITITGYQGSGGVVTIPPSINGLPVTSIAQQAFFFSSITDILIPGSVTYIGGYAFEYCTKLRGVYFEGNAPSSGNSVALGTLFNGDPTKVYYLSGASGWGSTFAGVTAMPLPSINLTANPTSGGVPLTVNFTSAGVDGGGNTISNWNWSFGDGLTSTAQNPSHTYTASGSFFVALIETDSNGLPVAGATASLTVSPPSIAFNANPTTGFVPLTVNFTAAGVDSVGNTIKSWFWSFGDGSSSISQNPSHIYSTVGIFSLALVSTNDLGETVVGSGPASISTAQAAQVQFTYTNINDRLTITGYTGSAGAVTIPSSANGLPVTGIGDVALANFNTMSSVLIPGSIADIGQFGFAYCSRLRSIYFEGNAPLIGTAAFDQDSATAYYLPGTTGWDGLSAAFVTIKELPSISITASPSNGVMPLTVDFTSAVTDSVADTINNWNWAFGDGSTSTVQNPSHTYTTNGTFSVALFATNNIGGLIAGAGASVAVAPPTLGFDANPTIGNLPLLVQFTSAAVDSGGHAIKNWRWSFGDGSTSTAQNPSHTYTIGGTFPITLVATNNLGFPVAGTGPGSVTVASGLVYSGLVLNGGFETGDFTGWQTNGDLSATFVYGGSITAPHSGNYRAVLGTTNSTGYLFQTLATTPAATYSLSFWLSVYVSTINEFVASWNGSTVFDGKNMPLSGWEKVDFPVTATGTSTVLQFGFRDDTGLLGLDDVSVVSLQLGIASVSLLGNALVLNAINGQAGSSYYLLTSPNVSLPVNQWTPVATNVLSASGDFTITAANVVTPGVLQQFYILQTH
jgi:PKD repeat protein